MRSVLWILLRTGMACTLLLCLSCCMRADYRCIPTQVPHGYGYLIVHGSDTLVYQPFIPALGFRQPFATASQARQVGDHVVRKLQQGLPPTLSSSEVDSLLRAAAP